MYVKHAEVIQNADTIQVLVTGSKPEMPPF